MPRIGRDGAQGLGCDLKQQAVDDGLVGIGDRTDRGRQSKDQVIVLDRQKVDLAGLEPAPGRTGLALWAMPVTAGVVGDLGMLTGGTLQHMATECGAAALLDRRHDLVLAQAEMPALGLPPSEPVGPEDIRDLERIGHRCRLCGRQPLKRTDDLAQDLGGHLGIQRGGLEPMYFGT